MQSKFDRIIHEMMVGGVTPGTTASGQGMGGTASNGNNNNDPRVLNRDHALQEMGFKPEDVTTFEAALANFEADGVNDPNQIESFKKLVSTYGTQFGGTQSGTGSRMTGAVQKQHAY